MNADEPERADAVVVGAGFAGMYMLYRLHEPVRVRCSRAISVATVASMAL